MSQATLNDPTSSTNFANPQPSGGAPVSSPALPPRTPPAASVVGYANPQGTAKRQGVNVRLIVFLGIVALFFLGPFYLFLKPMLNGGITQHNGFAEVELKALGNFPFNDVTGAQDDIPARWRGLDGKRVVLQGYMVPTRSAGPYVNEFQFVYNVQKCCFGGPPRVQERVFGHSRDSGGVELYSQDQFVKLTGILHVRVIRDEAGVIRSVFDLDVEKADPITG